VAQLFDTGIFSIIGLDSSIGSGWTLGFYLANSTTETDTYPTDADAGALTNANANPVVAASDGRFGQIWLPAGDYKYVLKDASAVTKVTVDDFNVPAAAPTITATLDDFLAGTDPLPIANGGTASATAANAIAALGGLPLVGGTVTGNITRSTKGSHLYFETAAMATAKVYLTASAAADPRAGVAGEIWLKY